MNNNPDFENSWEVLALDIGGGTQDLLLWSPNRSMENSVQCVLPSPTVMVARRIAEATRQSRPIFLSGSLMGGGASSQAIRRHLKSGLPVYAEPGPAMTLHDNLEYILEAGVILTETAPAEAVKIHLSDIQEEALTALLESFELSRPGHYLVAVQDHGYSPVESNRKFRFQHWERFLQGRKPLETLLYREVPDYLTRMRALQGTWPQARVMDTGAAAILGALEDDRNPGRAEELLVVNIGNEHTLGAWLVEGALKGIYEHHTTLLDREKLLDHLDRFVAGAISNEAVYADRGHGCLNTAPRTGRLPRLLVTGPRRHLLAGTRAEMAAPYGNMMLSGCFGLLRAYRGPRRDPIKGQDLTPANKSEFY
ncbi:MAG: DUF1786 domain-containing protein [Deltaproteobacteria bacterium]|nr:DUF1786 domain-containing protein [Deltaproteobacteria bacterium]